MSERGYTSATVFEAEGARVGIVVCQLCGAAILLDPREKFSATRRHEIWHEAQDQPASLPPEGE